MPGWAFGKISTHGHHFQSVNARCNKVLSMPCKHSRRQAHRFYSHAHSSCHQNRCTGNCKCYLSELGKVQSHHAPTCLFLQDDWTDGCKTMVRTGGLGNRRIYISVCRKNRDSIPFRTQADSPWLVSLYHRLANTSLRPWNRPWKMATFSSKL